jgi:probable F420-dependent oxidoreductase
MTNSKEMTNGSEEHGRLPDATFGQLGVWMTRGLIQLDEVIDVALTAEHLGFGGVWIAEGFGDDFFEDLHAVLAATDRVPVGSSIIGMYKKDPAEVTAAFWELERDFPGRFYLGVGPSHALAVDATNPGTYIPPLRKTKAYFNGLDTEAKPVPVERRVIPALGPLTLAYAAKHARGSIPYNMPVTHTSFARGKLGPGPLLATELGIVLSDDLSVARAHAREYLALYLTLPNYTDNFLRHGYDAGDLEHAGSDRLLDGLFGLGGPAEINARISEHLNAGADHIAIQVLPLPGQTRVEVLAEIARVRHLTS